MARLLALLVLSVVVGCAVPKTEGPKASDMPFIHGPAVAWTDDPKSGYHIELTVALQRNLTALDHLAFVVKVGADEVGRYRIAKGVVGTTVHQKVDELPLGDYSVELEYNGHHFAGEPFRIAVVPEWGGSKNLHLFRHHGTRVSLVEKKLWLLRWWSNDAPTLPWIVEWRHEGKIVKTTMGRERKWAINDSSEIVKYALAPQARRSIWQLGEEYTVPEQVGQMPGSWEARVIHQGAAPVSVEFTVLPNHTIGTPGDELVASVDGWAHAWSKPLELHPLAQEDIIELTDKLPIAPGAQQLQEGPIELTPNAVRALFRSKQLADQWSKFLGGSRELRGKIEALIKTQGGPWKPDEFPKS